MQQYDPMLDFYKRLIPFVFRQAPVIVFMFVAGLWLVMHMGDQAKDFRAQIIEAKAECSAAISEVRNELRVCRISNDTLVRQNIALHIRLLSLELRNKKK